MLKKKLPEDMQVQTGIAWYKKSQWEKLREVAVDPEVLDEDFAKWKASAEQKINNLEMAGVQVQRVIVDVDELVSWCTLNKRPNNSKARAEFSVSKLKRSGSST